MQPQDIIAILDAAGTAVVADIFDQLTLQPPVLDNRLFPVLEGSTFAGPAYTVAGEACTFSGSDRAKLEAIDGMPLGAVALWAGQGMEGVCCFGDLLATAMRARGVVAAVVDGGVRDVRFLRECGMPVFTRYRTPAQGVGRWKVTASQTPVKVRGALCEWLTISPGDMIVGDADGIIAIPVALVTQVAIAASQLSKTETGARSEIARGLALLDALSKYGHL